MLKSFTKVVFTFNQLSRSGRFIESALAVRAMSSTAEYNYSTLKVTTPSEFVKHVELNRPEKRNAMNTAFWREMRECFNQLGDDQDCRSIVMSGAGKMFTSGLDLQDNEAFAGLLEEADLSRKAIILKRALKDMQESFTVIEKCSKPVIAAVHSMCLGGGIDMITACDIRYCTQDAWFCIKEVDLGLAADFGTLQRFPKIVGNDSLTRELVYTARKFDVDEAKSIGLVSCTFSSKEEMMSAALELAKVIAAKSPVAIQGSKINLVYSRDHSVPEGLKYMEAHNSFSLQSEDVMKATMSSLAKETPVFSKL